MALLEYLGLGHGKIIPHGTEYMAWFTLAGHLTALMSELSLPKDGRVVYVACFLFLFCSI